MLLFTLSEIPLHPLRFLCSYFQSFPFLSFLNNKLSTMAPKKPWAPLTNPGTDEIPLPPPEISWPEHPVVKDHFWEKVRTGPIRAEAPAEGGSSEGGVQSFQTLFRDNEDGHGVTIPPRSVVRMRVERPEMPFGFVRFESKIRRHNDFKDWYDHILSQTDMAKFLEDVGVLRPLQYALLMGVDRSPVDLSFLLSRWSSHSHTFVAARGEFSPSLEDVVVLTGLPMFGVHHAVDVLDGEGESMLGLLHNAMERAKYISNKLTYLSWMTFFVKGEGRNAEFQLAAFFAYWLSYFVFPNPPDDGLNPFVFRMAVLLAQKKPVALGPWFLGSLYKRLDECGRNIARSVGRFDVVCYVEANFLQLYLWERFASIAPVPSTFAPVPSQRVQGVLKVDASLLRVRGTRWFGVKRPDQSGVPLREVVDEEDQFTFRPYSSTPVGVLPNLIYPARSG